MDAFPGYTYFDKTKKVLCVIQTVEDAEDNPTIWDTVMDHPGDDEIIKESDKVQMFEATDTPLGKVTVGQMITPDTYVGEDNVVYGTIKHVDGFTEFNPASEDEQSGYYFPFKLSKSTGTTMTTYKNGELNKEFKSFDQDWILRVEPGQFWEIDVDGETAALLNFAVANFEE